MIKIFFLILMTLLYTKIAIAEYASDNLSFNIIDVIEDKDLKTKTFKIEVLDLNKTKKLFEDESNKEYEKTIYKGLSKIVCSHSLVEDFYKKEALLFDKESMILLVTEVDCVNYINKEDFR